MNTTTHTALTLETPLERRKPLSAQAPDYLFLLRGILEGMPDGIMIVTHIGTIIQQNSRARLLCQRIDPQQANDNLPAAIQHLCNALKDSRDTFADTPDTSYLAIEDDIECAPTGQIRVRVQWLQQEPDETRMLVILEDRYQSARCRAIAEGQRYGLSNRESEVWLYRCIGYTYKEIASELFITVDTVKKHVKSINVKRDRFHCLNYIEP